MADMDNPTTQQCQQQQSKPPKRDRKQESLDHIDMMKEEESSQTWSSLRIPSAGP
jgi:SET domain-containing protein